MTAVTMLVVAAVGCLQSRARLQAGLERAGLDTLMSECVADRLVDRLSLAQLRRIGALGNLRNDLRDERSVERFLLNLSALRDPEILAVSSTSAATCAVAVRLP